MNTTLPVAHSFSKALGSRCVTNSDLSALMDTSDEWIRQRTGIQTRYWIQEGETTSGLALAAARQTLEQAGLDSVDCIIAATLSPDFGFPGIGVQIQHGLGLPAVPAYDIRNQCSGFLYALEMASALVRVGTYRRVLVVGAEVHSTGLDISTRGRDLAVLFGDGAGSCIVETPETLSEAIEGLHIVGSELHSNGAYVQELWCEHPGSVRYPVRLTPEMVAEGLIFPKMNGKRVFEHAVRSMTEVSRSLLKRLNLEASRIGLLVPHQANLRINSYVAQELGLRADQVWSTIEKYGNTTAATIPIGLSDAFEARAIPPGTIVLSAAFGSGFTWGAMVFQAREGQARDV